MEKAKRLGEGKVLAFAFSMFGASLFYSLVNSYFNFYATDVAKVPAGMLGTVNFIIKLVMVFLVVALASLVQNGQSAKYGKYRQWILIASPIFTITTILTFTKVSGSDLFLVLYYSIMYALASGAHSLAGNAQLALMTEMGRTEEDSRRLSARRSLLQDISKVLFSASFVPLLMLIGGSETSSAGYFWWAVAIAIISLLGYVSLMYVSKPFDIYQIDLGEKSDAQKKMSFGEMMSIIFKNRPLIIMLIAETLKFTAFMIFIQTFAYYFGYVLFDFVSITPVVTIASIISIVSSLIAPFIMKVLGQKTTCLVSLGLYAVGVLLPRLLPPSVIVMGIGFGLVYFAMSLQTCAGVVMFADCAKYYESKHGVNVAGFTMGLYTFPVQLGLAISAGAANWALEAINYTPGSSMDAAQIEGLKNIVLLIPGILFVAALVFTLFYPLTNKKMESVQAELDRRNV